MNACKYCELDTRAVKMFQNLLGLTNRQTSEKAGICEEHYSRFFRNRTKKVFKRTACNLANALGVTVEKITIDTE